MQKGQEAAPAATWPFDNLCMRQPGLMRIVEPLKPSSAQYFQHLP